MAKIGVFFGEGYEECEALLVVDLCRRAGIEVETVSITEEKCVISAHKVPILMDTILAEVDFDSIDMIVLPGGLPGTTNLEACEPLMEQLDAFYQNGRYLSAICAAPSIFGHRGYLKGRNAISYPSFVDDLEGAIVKGKPVEISDFIITGQGLGAGIEFALAIVERLKGKETAEKIAGAIVHKRSTEI